MQATGMVNDHLVTCFRYRECVAAASASKKRVFKAKNSKNGPSPN
jgi:hypothetical protein